MFWIILIFVVLYLVVKFMEGYNKMDTPHQVRKISKTQQPQSNSHRLKELEKEKEILELRKEVEELKKK